MIKPVRKIADLDLEQRSILYVYSLYTLEEKYSYLQYTAACALIYHLTKQGLFTYNTEELLYYDYLDKRHYIWESKKFMTDINILRDHGFLTRARLNSKLGRDVNAHQCSTLGKEYVENLVQSKDEIRQQFNKIKTELSCVDGSLKEIVLKKDAPYLVCQNKSSAIAGFVKHFEAQEDKSAGEVSYNPFFMSPKTPQQ